MSASVANPLGKKTPISGSKVVRLVGCQNGKLSAGNTVRHLLSFDDLRAFQNGDPRARGDPQAKVIRGLW
jgi:hypothetical protein